MINDILDMARLEAGRLEASPTRFHIGAIIDAQIDMARPLVDKKNIDLICQLEPDLPPMFQDESRIGQILNNLLSNAIKFTPEGGKITVSVRRRSESPDPSRPVLPVNRSGASDPTPPSATRSEILRESFREIRVADTGVGIAAEDQSVIFEKFRQAGGHGDATMTREHSGSGLGLSIVKELCRLLEGEIFVESRLGFGSVFTVILPWEFQSPVVSESPILSELREFSQSRAGRKPAHEEQ